MVLSLKTPKNTRNELARPVMGTIFLVIHEIATVDHKTIRHVLPLIWHTGFARNAECTSVS